MKRTICKILLTLTALTFTYGISLAHDFEVDGIYYNITSPTSTYKTVEVAYKSISSNTYSDEYIGWVVIPQAVNYEGFTYSVTSIGYSAFSGCTGLTSVTIPNSVISIGICAFAGCTGLTSVTIPNSVASIYEGAFSGCTGLTTVNFNATNCEKMGTYSSLYGDHPAFDGCTNLATLNIGENVTNIPDYAFRYCTGLTTVNFNAINCAYMGSYNYPVFYDCTKLTTLNIGKNVTNIPSYAFDGCNGLQQIFVESENPTYDSRNNCNAIIETATNRLIKGGKNTIIPNGVTIIGNEAIYSDEMPSIIIPSSVISVEGLNKAKKIIWLTNTPPDGYGNVLGTYHYVSNNAYSNLQGVVTEYPYLSSLFEVDGVRYVPVSPSERTCDAIDCVYDTTATDININNTVSYKGISMTLKKIKPYTCYDNDFIRNINIDFNDTIPKYAFYGCDSVTEAIINANVISGYAFSNCATISPASITVEADSIGICAFGNCSAITNATINASKIGMNAFSGCFSIKHLNIKSNDIFDYAFLNCAKNNPAIFNIDTKTLGAYSFSNCYGVENIILGDELITISKKAFYDCRKLQGINLPNSVMSLGEYAFYNCMSLVEVNIGSGVSKINDYTFSGCQSLPQIIIPNTVTSIGNYVFSDCISLANVTISDRESSLSLGSNGANPFFSDCKLKSVYIGGDITYNTSVDYGYSPFYNNSSLESVVIADNETEITENEFYNCANLKNILIGNDVVNINYRAFYNCSSLELITIPDNVGFLGASAFYGCSSLKSVQIGTGVPEIEDSTFYNCKSLPSINIPSNVSSIGDYAFGGCASLSDVTIADRETELSLGSNSSNPLFVDCPLKTVYIGGNITYPTSSSYGYSPFYRNTSLETVKITDKETEISENEFYGCTGLKNITMGDGVETIGNWAFSGCSSLDYFEFGSGMKSIGDEAFSDCTVMTKLVSNASVPPTCGTQALDDINKWTCELYIPGASMSAYQAAEQWKEFFFLISKKDDIKNDIIDTDDAEEIDRYDIYGRQITEPTKGINIIKMSDGSTRKEYVK